MINLVNADCIEAMSKLSDKSIDLVVTDIPYGEVNRKSAGLRNLDKDKADVVNFNLPDLVDELCRLTKGSIYIFCGINQVSTIRETMTKNKMSTRLCIWEKTNPSPMNGDKIWLSGVEACVFGKFPKATFNEHCKNTVFKYPCGRNKIHPTQKPEELIERLVLASSNVGDLVLDPFSGSGTTAVVCKKNSRNFIGFELDKEYYDKAVDRIASTM
jgi:DNA modification methylase